MLRKAKAMPDVFLLIQMEHDPSAAASAILADLLLLPSDNRQGANPTESSNASPHQYESSERANKLNLRRIKPTSKVASSRNRSWLSQTLLRDIALATKARKCLVTCIASALDHNTTTTTWGKATLFTKSLALTVSRIGIGAGSSKGAGSKFVQDSMTLLAKLAQTLHRVDPHSSISPPTVSLGDPFRRIALCLCLATCSKFPPIADAKETFMGGPASTACETCLSALLSPSVSDESDVFAARVACCLASRDASEVSSLVFQTLCEPECRFDPNEEEVNAYVNVCRWVGTKLGSEELETFGKRGVSSRAVLADASAVIDAVRRCRWERDVDFVVEDVLSDAEKCGLMFSKRRVLELIQQVIELLLKRSGSRVPLILPLRLESLGKKILWKEDYSVASNDDDDDNDDVTNGNLRRQFVLHLLYCFEFLDRAADSPFVFDPRALPLREALSFCEHHFNGDKGTVSAVKTYHSRLRDLMSKWCPEILFQCSLSADHRHYPSLPVNPSPTAVCNAIQACIRDETNQNDPSGCRAEMLFLRARAHRNAATIDTAATRALLSSRHAHSPFYTHSALCKDPLVLLKCNIKTWRIRGLRRIALTILKHLSDVNSHVTFRSSPSSQAALEMISARDLIVVRCLVISASGGFVLADYVKGECGPVHCPMTVSMVRSIVARRRGLATALIKQGLPDCAVDWLVEFVPESFQDAPALTACLSERTALTAAERLATADAALRIAIAHGARDEDEAHALAYASLSCLVSSFYLVIGPIGVAVNVLCEEGGVDVTQKCRKSTFRMLSAMQRIKGRRERLKNEACMALAKIAGFCKSESLSGVVGLAAMRRKAVLKDIFDATIRAVNAMGGGIQI